MKIIFKHILRNIKEHKMRSFLIFFSLLVSTSVFIISLTISDDLMIKIEDTLRSVYGDAEVQVVTVDPFKLEDLKINKDEYEIVGSSLVDGLAKNEKPLSLIGLDLKKAKEFKMMGSDVSDLELNEVYVNEYLANLRNYKKGDILSFVYENETYELVIKGIIKNEGLASFKPDDDTFYTSNITVNNIKKIDDDYYDVIYFNVLNNNRINSFVNYLKDYNDNYMISKTVDMDAIKDATSMISTIMYLIVLMATIMIFFVISSLNKIILAERIPVIGTFRSVGASRNKMNFILVLENAFYGIFAGLIGAIVGTYLDSFCSSVFISADGIDVSKEAVHVSLQTVLIGILFATALQVFVTVKEIIRTNKKPIKDLIFNTQNSRYRMRKRRTQVGFVLLISSILVFLIVPKLSIMVMAICIICFMVGVANSLPLIFQLISKGLAKIFKKSNWATGIIASKNIGYNKMIISSSRLVVIAISLLSSIIMMSNAITNAFTNFRHTTKGIDLMVSGTHYSSENYKYLNDIEGVKEVHFLNSYFPEEVTYNNGKSFTTALGLYAEEKHQNYIVELDYKMADLKDDEMLFDEKYAYQNNIHVGDTITINYSSLNKEFTYKIVGLVDASNFNVSRNMAVVSYKHLVNDLNGIPMQLHIVLDNKKDAEKMKDVIKDNIKEVGITVQTTEEYIVEQENQIAGIVSIVYLVIGISVMLAFIGIINNQVIGFIQRRKELAILYSTSMNKIQIKKMLAYEVIVANLISLFLAILVALITTVFVNDFLINIGLFLNVEFDLVVILKFVLIVYIILLLTLIVPFRKLRKMNIVDEIKYE